MRSNDEQDDDDSATILDGVPPSGPRRPTNQNDDPRRQDNSAQSADESLQDANKEEDDYDDYSMAQSGILVAPTPEPQKKKKKKRGTSKEEEESSSPRSSAPLLFSPATQTLNALSQNMDDLRYDNTTAMKNRHQEESSSSSRAPENFPDSETELQGLPNQGVSKVATTTATKAPSGSSTTESLTSPPRLAPPDPKNCLPPDEWKNYYRDRYEWIPVHGRGDATTSTAAAAAGAGVIVGMVIQRDQFFSSQGAAGGPSAHHRQMGMVHCKILRVIPGSLAEECGIRVNDWMCRAAMTKDESPILAEFGEVQAWAKTRSIRASVLRLKSPNLLPPTKPPPKFLEKIAPIESQATVLPSFTAGREPLPGCNTLAAHGEETLVESHGQDSLLLKKRWNREAEASVGTSTGEVVVSKDSGNVTKIKTKIRTPSSTDKDVHASKILPPGNNNKAKAKSSNDDERLPFCRLCQHLKKYGIHCHSRRKPRSHHAWCPFNSFFENNGGQDLLDRIQQGRNELHCLGCEREYQSGKLESAKTHSQLCLQNQKRLKKLIQDREDEEDRKEKAEKEMKKKRVRRKEEKTKARLLLSSSEDDDDNEEPSEYQPRRKKRRTMDPPSDRKVKAFTTPQEGRKPTRKSESSSHTPNAKSIAAKASKEQPRRVTPPPPPTETRKESPAACARQEASSTTRTTSTAQTATDRAPKNQQPQTRSTTIKSRWEMTMENPWGPHGHQQGDVMMYGPQKGLGHYETLLPSLRYVLHPFAAHSNYCTTHCTPDEGFTVLCLQRDPSARSPWGFGVARDDFGHACLVEHVQPMLAASAATAVGSDQMVGLKVHDMIIMINGQCVGGMTQVGLELELETSGPRLILVVSRYKHARAAAQQLAAMERNMLRVMDKACRDERLLGWHEVGNAAVHVQAPGSSAYPALDSIEEDPRRMIVDGTRDENNVMDIDRASSSKGSPLKQTHVDAYGNSDGEERPDHMDDKEDSSPYSSLLQSCVLEREVVKPKSEKGNAYSSGSDVSAGGNSESDNEEWEEDQNAWNGCVCGKIHSKGTRVFWIQCEDCESWHDVSEKCVGFTEKQAEKVEKWTCWACVGSESSPSPSPHPRKVMPSEPNSVASPLDDQQKTIEASHASDPETPIFKDTSPPSDCHVVALLQLSQTGFEYGEVSAEAESEMQDSLAVHCGDRGQLKAVSETEKPLGKDTRKKIGKDARPHRVGTLLETDDGCLISKAKLKKREDGMYRRPHGPSPNGFTWDEWRGVWAPLGMKASPTGAVVGKSGSTGQANQRHNDVDTNLNKKVGTDKKHSRPRNKTKTEPGKKHPREDVSSSEFKKPSVRTERISGTGDVHLVFGKGDLVFVEHHAWPGWNIEEGIGRVNKSYVDEDGDRFYDIKYAIGRSVKGISAEFIRSHSFGD